MMEFLSFVALLAIAYMVWRVGQVLPDLVYRLSEIQRELREIRTGQHSSGPTGEPSSDDGARKQAGG